MKLEDYVYESWSPEQPAMPFPGALEIPGYLIRDFRELYALTEKGGRECGYILFYEGKSWPIRHDIIASGLATSMNIPKSHSYYNFGNAHGHPSGSIGHSGGYSPHSMEDLLTFKDEADRTMFIQFVVSGPKLYAMVFRHGWSRVGDPVQGFALDKRGEIMAEADKHLKKGIGDDEYFRKMGEFAATGNTTGANVWLNELKSRTGFGKKMEELSISACKGFARRFGYGFYIGKTQGFGTGNLHRQK